MRSRRYPESRQLFLAIAGEAEACIHRTDWERRMENIRNLLTVIRSRITAHRERMFDAELERLVRSARWADCERNKEVDRNVGQRD